jgi:hypothetical protein
MEQQELFTNSKQKKITLCFTSPSLAQMITQEMDNPQFEACL